MPAWSTSRACGHEDSSENLERMSAPPRIDPRGCVWPGTE